MVFKIPGHFQVAGGNEQNVLAWGGDCGPRLIFGNFTI